MSFEPYAIQVEGVSKRFELFDKPVDQLKQLIFPKIQRTFGRPEGTYFREFWALRDISFCVKRGEAFAIIGRNGSGKSTLLQIITGTLTQSIGNIQTNGRVAALLELGSGFNPDFSGRENVYLNGAILGLNKDQIDKKFDAIAGFADIGDHLDQAVRTYSSGMLMRLAMAVQTQVEPDILIVDEALAVGDALFQKKCYRQIDKLLNNGCALLFVSHDQEIVRTLTSKAIFLNEGRAVRSGATPDVLFAYREFLQKQEEAAFQDMQKRTDRELNDINESKSFGNYEVEITQVDILGLDHFNQSVFYAGDNIEFAVKCICHMDLDNLNVAFRILTKEGVKVTTWGTLNEDMPFFSDDNEKTFWHKKFQKGQEFEVRFKGKCNLGANLYELQVVVAREHDQYYANQQVLHWLDEAGHFTVILKAKEYVFDGVCDMGLRSNTNDLDCRSILQESSNT